MSAEGTNAPGEVAPSSVQPNHPMSGMDAFAPEQIADLVRTRGVAKATSGAATTFVLGIVAGAFIALGALFATTVGTARISASVRRVCSRASPSPSD
jgi:hypothetical protein